MADGKIPLWVLGAGAVVLFGDEIAAALGGGGAGRGQTPVCNKPPRKCDPFATGLSWDSSQTSLCDEILDTRLLQQLQAQGKFLAYTGYTTDRDVTEVDRADFQFFREQFECNPALVTEREYALNYAARQGSGLKDVTIAGSKAWIFEGKKWGTFRGREWANGKLVRAIQHDPNDKGIWDDIGGILKPLGVIGGAILAPFTGGLSLAVGAAAAGIGEAVQGRVKSTVGGVTDTGKGAVKGVGDKIADWIRNL